MEKPGIGRRAALRTIISVACIFVSGFLLFYAYKNITKNMSASNLRRVAQQNCMVYDMRFADNRSMLRNVSETLRMFNQMSTEELSAYLDRSAAGNNLFGIYLIDSEGYAMGKSGEREKIRKSADLELLLEGREEIFRVGLYNDLEDAVFVGIPVEPYEVAGRRVAALAMAYSNTALYDSLNQELYDGDATVILADGYGNTFMHVAGKETEEKNYDTVEEYFSGLKFSDKNKLSEMTESAIRGQGTTTWVRDEQREYCLSVLPFESMDGYQLFMVPSEVIEASVRGKLDEVLWQSGLSLVLAALMLIYFNLYTYRLDKAQYMEMASARDAAEAANRAKSSFLSNVSHDIRTPMNAITGMARIARENISDEKCVADCLTKIDVSSRLLLGIINDVLDMSKIEAQKIELANQAISLTELVESNRMLVEKKVEEKQLSLTVHCENISHDTVLGDPVRISQIIMNILSNAVKCTPDGGRITVEASELPCGREGQGRYRFVISDTGVGMSEEFQKHIFEPFTQENDFGRSSYKGTGLGMAITKNLVEMMGGHIEVESSPGKGSVFRVELVLPLTSRTAVLREKEEGTGSVFKSEEIMNCLRGKQCLLVEDNELNAEIAEAFLSMAGMKSMKAVNGREAVERYLKMEPGFFDVILMDILMPVMNGYDACREIRASGRPDSLTVPIVAMTANAFSEDVERAGKSGMNAHITKPVDADRMMHVLKEVLAGDEIHKSRNKTE